MTPVHICPSTRPRRLAAAVCLAAALTVSACAEDPDPAATATDAATAAEATTAAEGAVHSPEAATAQATTPAAPDAPEARTVCPDEAGDVVVIAGDIDCGEAVDVMAEYERRRGAEGGGNAPRAVLRRLELQLADRRGRRRRGERHLHRRAARRRNPPPQLRPAEHRRRGAVIRLRALLRRARAGGDGRLRPRPRHP